jgi:hypothetical protein
MLALLARRSARRSLRQVNDDLVDLGFRALHQDAARARGICRLASGCQSLRVSGWLSGYEPDTHLAALLLARSRDLALHLARGRGSPPLRFASTRGPPSSTNTSTDVYGKARCRAWCGSERAAVSEWTTTGVQRAPACTASLMKLRCVIGTGRGRGLSDKASDHEGGCGWNIRGPSGVWRRDDAYRYRCMAFTHAGRH